MRLLMDLFPCQTTSRLRGIGRYAFFLAQAMAKESKSHEFRIAANAVYPESIEMISQKFRNRLPQGYLSVYSHPERKAFWNEQVFEVVSSSVIHRAYQAVAPNAILYSSPFEGLFENGIVAHPNKSLPGGLRVALLYDFIPYYFPEDYFNRASNYKSWYLKRLGLLHKFDLLLSISESTRRDAIKILGISPDRVVNISGAAETIFTPKELSSSEKLAITKRFNITHPFVFCVSNTDFRKNFEGMLSAYARLPREIRKQHQLVVNHVKNEEKILRQIRKLGLDRKEIIITGHVNEEELVDLYNLCKLFVFPSLYEGLGLPIIEAMACGAPVIAANNSSQIEVVGRSDLLVDAKNPDAMASAMDHILSDETFRQDVINYSLQRVQNFSWEKTACRAWEAIEGAESKQNDVQKSVAVSALPKYRIAFLSPFPPQQSGIAYYSAELLPFLSRHFEIDLFVEFGDEITDPFLTSSFSVYPHTELANRRHLYESIVYQFGNSPFHSYMLKLLAEFPGVVVLHDFFLSNLPFDLEFLKGEPGTFVHKIFTSHGLKGALQYVQFGHEMARKEWPINREILTQATSVIVHSPLHKELLKRFYGTSWQPNLQVIPQLRKLPSLSTAGDRIKTRNTLGISTQEFLVTCFGWIAPTKMNHEVIEAFAIARKELGSPVRLIFVGQVDAGVYGHELKQKINELGLDDAVSIVGFVDTERYEAYLTVADATIQLRTDSRGETSRAVLDCLAYGLPVIMNDHATFNDYENDIVVKIKEQPSVKDISDAVVFLYQEDQFRHAIAQRGRDWVEHKHHPVHIAEEYARTIHASIPNDERRVMENIVDALEDIKVTAEMTKNIVNNVTSNAMLRKPSRLLIDVTRISEKDPRTGIERVVKNTIRQFVARKQPDLFIELVRLHKGELRRANRFAEAMFDLPAYALGDEVEIDLHQGDTLFMLDASWIQYSEFSSIFTQVRHGGGKIITAVYDLIPLQHPKTCHQIVLEAFEPWIKQAISESEQLVCISQNVADDLLQYIKKNSHLVHRPLQVDYWHLGADSCNHPVKKERVREGVVQWLKNKDHSRSTFLMVGTIEPRKGHSFVLDAFDELWEQGSEARLCIVGKEGWNVSDLMQRIRAHQEANSRLLYIDRASEGELTLAYQSIDALLSASIAEGGGLPILEAALHKKPAIVSDIPAFREIGGEGAIYFALEQPQSLVDAIDSFCKKTRSGKLKLGEEIKTLSWKESADRLLKIINGLECYASLQPSKGKKS